MIGKDGKTIQNRQPIARTGCTRNQEVNLSAISIVLAGDFDVEEPTEEQLTSLRALVKELDSTYHFKAIVGHRDASPSSCPGKYLLDAIKDILRGSIPPQDQFIAPVVTPEPKGGKDLGVWTITRYYTPVENQDRYYRSVSDDKLLDKAIEYGVVVFRDGKYVHMNETPAGLLTRELGSTKAMANDAMLSDTLVTYLVRRTVEYKMDFAVNCQGDCFVTADGTDLHNAKPLTVLACPPELKHGTKLWIEGYGEAVCHDRGGAIKDKRIDIWAGIGVQAVDYIKSVPIKEDNEKSSRSESLFLPHHCHVHQSISRTESRSRFCLRTQAAQEIHRLQIHRCVRRLHRPESEDRRVLAERLTSAAS